jgi:hypothetical protein
MTDNQITFHKQLNLHDPENGLFGDCFRTALACLCGLLPEQVPNFFGGIFAEDDDAPEDALKEWLASRGLSLVQQAMIGTIKDLPKILKTVGARDNPGIYYLLSGQSRIGCDHTVICRDGEIVWDPSLTDSGIIGPLKGTDQFLIEFLAVYGGAPALRRAT